MMLKISVLLALCLGLIAVFHNNAPQASLDIAPTVEDIRFDSLINAPNGHISFQKNPQGFRIWVPGRRNLNLQIQPDQSHEEGGFMFDISDWSSDVLAVAKPTFTLGHLVDDDEPNCGPYIYDRNYTALNAVVPGAESNTLLGFYDAEYHVDCPNGEPLLSSIGITTSTDGGVTWQNQSQIIEGLDEATLTAKRVTKTQDNALPHIVDCGASGPSVVVREADNSVYLYLYYADRTPLTGGPDSIYVARALLTSDGSPGNWQKWDDTGWAKIGKQSSAAPIVLPSTRARVALQPHVSWNSNLGEWLMVFKTAIDFELATSVDGIRWNPPVSLITIDQNNFQAFGFPTLISVDDGETSQQVTGASAYLYWSSLPVGGVVYGGHRALVTISDNTPPVTTASLAGPLNSNGSYSGPTTLSFSATDDFSGVAKTEYSIDGGTSWVTANSIVLKVSGTYSFLFRSTDVVGNVETAKSINVTLDIKHSH